MVPIFTYEHAGTNSQPTSQSPLLHCPGQIPHQSRSQPPIKERCSSAVITGSCQGSRPTCGSLSPITPHKETEQTSVFSPFRQFPHTITTATTTTSPLSVTHVYFSFRDHFRSKPKLSLVLLLWVSLSPAVIGLIIGLIFGWTKSYSLPAITTLFIASFCLVISVVTITLTCPQVTGNRSGYQTLFGNNTERSEVGTEEQKAGKVEEGNVGK
eukprot:GFUD01116308.1.p1 GENE.GFUD01116308.1~~GFUD01116308.1.p1  ORF type:complete len:228 (-),score=64.08 GFUD01116308.1:59-694(-)